MRIRAGVAAFGMTMLVVVGYGAIRLSTAPAIGTQETVSIASFTMVENHMGELNTLLNEDGVVAFREKTQPVHAQYLAMTQKAINDGAKIVLFRSWRLLVLKKMCKR